MARLLRMIGYEVAIADSYQAAMTAVNRDSFDLALCDMRLPDGDGIDLHNELRAKKNIRTIALTASADPEMMQRMREF